MQIAFNINKKFHKLIKSSIHYDNTSRIHMVKKKQNYKYWKLLIEIKKNRCSSRFKYKFQSSWNCNNFYSRQAIEHAMEGCMDILVIGNYVIEVKKIEKFNQKSQKTYSEKESLIKSLEKGLKY